MDLYTKHYDNPEEIWKIIIGKFNFEIEVFYMMCIAQEVKNMSPFLSFFHEKIYSPYRMIKMGDIISLEKVLENNLLDQNISLYFKEVKSFDQFKLLIDYKDKFIQDWENIPLRLINSSNRLTIIYPYLSEDQINKLISHYIEKKSHYILEYLLTKKINISDINVYNILANCSDYLIKLLIKLKDLFYVIECENKITIFDYLLENKPHLLQINFR